MPLLSSYLKVKSIFPWPVIPDSVIRSKLLGHDPSSPGTRFAASMPFSQATQGKRPVDHWLSSSSRRGSSQSSPPSKALEAPKNEEKIVIIILIILIIIIMKQPPAVTASGWMISPESFAKRLWMVLEDPHKVLGFRQNVAGDALAPGSQLSAPKKNSAATVVGLPKNGGRPKNGHQTMGKTMINQESLIFAVPKSATKPSWAT